MGHEFERVFQRMAGPLRPTQARPLTTSEFLRQCPNGWFTAADMGRLIGCRPDTVSARLGKLRKRGVVALRVGPPRTAGRFQWRVLSWSDRQGR